MTSVFQDRSLQQLTAHLKTARSVLLTERALYAKVLRNAARGFYPTASYAGLLQASTKLEVGGTIEQRRQGITDLGDLIAGLEQLLILAEVRELRAKIAGVDANAGLLRVERKRLHTLVEEHPDLLAAEGLL